ncbi:MAG: hypothetical protein K2O18_14220 [Oscillospiraceae bacterium]|nr:hypothetical protein [Oscillospiraceae bacterium]
MKKVDKLLQQAKELAQRQTVFEQLKKDALYAQRSYSKELLYQTHGAAQMARQLGAITHEEAVELNWMTVTFMNTNQDYIQHQSEELSAIAAALVAPEEGGKNYPSHTVKGKNKGKQV